MQFVVCVGTRLSRCRKISWHFLNALRVQGYLRTLAHSTGSEGVAHSRPRLEGAPGEAAKKGRRPDPGRSLVVQLGLFRGRLALIVERFQFHRGGKSLRPGPHAFSGDGPPGRIRAGHAAGRTPRPRSRGRRPSCRRWRPLAARLRHSGLRSGRVPWRRLREPPCRRLASTAGPAPGPLRVAEPSQCVRPIAAAVVVVALESRHRVGEGVDDDPTRVGRRRPAVRAPGAPRRREAARSMTGGGGGAGVPKAKLKNRAAMNPPAKAGPRSMKTSRWRITPGRPA